MHIREPFYRLNCISIFGFPFQSTADKHFSRLCLQTGVSEAWLCLGEDSVKWVRRWQSLKVPNRDECKQYVMAKGVQVSD